MYTVTSRGPSCGIFCDAELCAETMESKLLGGIERLVLSGVEKHGFCQRPV